MNDLIEKANEAYYGNDEKIITDQEFDLLSDNGLEMKNFRNKVDHHQPMGSLKKVKDQKTYDKWMKSQIKRITVKLDGNSVELVCVGRTIRQAITRGNGFIGNDITDRIKFCNVRIGADIPDDNVVRSFKCEAIMKKEHQKHFDKNIRNVVAGLLNSKVPDVASLSKIDVVSFDILDNIACFANHETYEDLEKIFNLEKKENLYEIDGLVIEIDPVHKEKDPLLPENTVALKFNKEGVDAEVGYIEWNIGKHQKLTPVLVLKEAVEIDGTMVGRVSASNYALVQQAGLGPGAKIQVIKSGDIIPFVSKVVEPKQLLGQVVCPVCKGFVRSDGVNIYCANAQCPSVIDVMIKNFFSMLDLEYISDSTIQKLIDNGYNTIPKIFEITKDQIKAIPGFGESKANNILSKLKKAKMYDYQVLAATLVKGIATSQSKKLINHFGSLKQFLEWQFSESDLRNIESFGDVLSSNVWGNMPNFRSMYNTVHSYVKIITTDNEGEPAKEKVVCTGKWDRYGRKEIEKILRENGIELQKSVNKETNYLITNDPDSNSGKTKKAKQLGIRILTYDDYFGEI